MVVLCTMYKPQSHDSHKNGEYVKDGQPHFLRMMMLIIQTRPLVKERMEHKPQLDQKSAPGDS